MSKPLLTKKNIDCNYIKDCRSYPFRCRNCLKNLKRKKDYFEKV